MNNDKIINLKKIENSIPQNNHIFPKKYDEIALYLASRLVDIVPFQLCSDIDKILLGTCCKNIKNQGYLGNSCVNYLKFMEIFPPDNPELKKIIKDNINFIKGIFNLSQKYLVLPIIKDILELAQLNNEQWLENSYLSKINELLGLSNLDEYCAGNSWICSEILNRMESCELIKFVNKKGRVREKREKKYIIINNINGDYNVPNFYCPLDNRSQLHYNTFKLINSYIKKEKLKDMKIEQEIKFDDGKYENTNMHFRFDIGVYQNDKLLFLVETDGEQHFKEIKHWHRGNNNFDSQKQKDYIKNMYIINNGLKLLRIGYNEKDENIYSFIEQMYNNKGSCINYYNKNLYCNMISSLPKKYVCELN